jgi:hypothetical protein
MRYKTRDSPLIYKSEYLELYEDLLKINNIRRQEEQGKQENEKMLKQLRTIIQLSFKE